MSNIEDKKVVKQPRMYLTGGTFSAAIWITIMIAFPYMPKEPELDLGGVIMFYSLAGMLTLTSLIMLMYYLNWEIALEGDRFIYRNILRQKKTYKYNDCLSHVQSARVDIYHKNNIRRKIFSVSLLSSEWTDLSEKVTPFFEKYQNK